MKISKLLVLLIFVISFFNAFAQPQQGGSTCAGAAPICTDYTYDFPLNTTGTAESGPDYGCLNSQPKPTWYYLKINEPGDLTINIASTCGDIDYAAWGPFTSVTCSSSDLTCTGCSGGGNYDVVHGNMVDCAYSGSQTEELFIPNAQNGEFYMVMITNFFGCTGNAVFSKISGTATTDCSILDPCEITNITATASDCDPYTNNYSVSGRIDFTDQPDSGFITITDDITGAFVTYDSPFSSPIAYTIPGIDSDGAAHAVTAVFSEETSCENTATYTAPDACRVCETTADTDGIDKVCGLRFDHLSATINNGDYNTIWTSSPAAGVTFDDETSPTTAVAVTDPGTYVFTWTVTNMYDTTCYDTWQMVFSPYPTSVFTVTDPNCLGSNSTITYVGDAPDDPSVTYNWTWDGGLPNPIMNFGRSGTVHWNEPGIHTVTLVVTQGNCTSTTPWSQNVYTPEELTVTTTVTDLACAAGTGSVVLDVQGGTEGYSYTWSNGSQTWTGNDSLDALTTDVYYVTVTDTLGCTDTVSFQPTSPDPLTLVSDKVNLKCFQDGTGEAIVTVGGGQPPYAYLWNTNQTDPHLSNLAAGAYTITVRDGNDCILPPVTINISEPSALIATISDIDSTNCYGDCNGAATISPMFGTPPYSINWDDNETSMTNVELCAGSHSITITDVKSCDTVYSVSIPQPAPLTTVMGSKMPLCYASSDGYIYAEATGGTEPYNYIWEGMSGDTLTGVGYGSYEVTINDDHGCSITQTDSVRRPPLLTSSIVYSENVKCYGSCDGIGKVEGNGGTEPYSYLWWQGGGAGGNRDSVFNLCNGPHTVTVTDVNGCYSSVSIDITQPPLLVLTQDYYKEVTCYNYCDAEVSYSAIGGTEPLNFLWNSGETTSSLTNVCPGDNYLITVTDKNGCVRKDSVVFEEPQEIVISSSVSDDGKLCLGGNVVITVDTLATGVEPYTFYLDGEEVSNPMPVAPITSTNYSMYIKDANGCNSQPVYSYVRVIPAVDFELAVDKDSICPGDPVVISISNGPSGGGNGHSYDYEISWIDGNHPPPYEEVNPPFSGYYIVGIQGPECNFFKTDSVFVYVFDPPPFLVSADSTAGCVPFTTTFHEASPDEGQDFVWSFGDASGETSILKNPTHTYETPGQYKVTLRITSKEGCTTLNAPFSSFIEARAIPETRFSYIGEDENGISILRPEVAFTDESTGIEGDGESLWSFMYNKDGFVKDSLTEENPLYTFDRAGLWTVTLRTTSDYSCTSEISSQIFVEETSNIYFPNAFRPNSYKSDNRGFAPKGNFKEEGYHMQIFNRWGEQVFETKDIHKVWRGVLNGKTLEVGVYTYIVTYVSFAEVEYTKSGTVTLIQ